MKYHNGIAGTPETSGRCAAECGKPMSACPYGTRTKNRERWITGYKSAKVKK